MKWNDYDEMWEFENLAELEEYSWAYSSVVPDEFIINIDNREKYFKLIIKGKYNLFNYVRIYESYNYATYEGEYIKIIEHNDRLFTELKEFEYIDKENKKHTEFIANDIYIDSDKIDDMCRRIEQSNVFITEIK